MIEASDITKGYGEQLLFEAASFTILPGERVGLVGRNGHGKTTLLKMIIGEEGIDLGRISIPKGYKIGYLKQILNFTEKNVLLEVCSGLPHTHAAEVWQCEKILAGLGFSDEDMEKPPTVFSGGYQMRIELAKVLVSNPDMLFLDEPTNFLDITSIRWLEKFLKKWRGELVVISHDRRFMDSVVTHIIGIHRNKIRKMEGTTEKYYSTIAKDEEIYEKKRLNDEKKRKQVEEYITTFRAKATKAKSVQSSIRMLEKMGKADKLENIRTLSFSFNSLEFRPPVVMEAKDISFSYSGEEPYLINDFNLTVARGEKICIAGANGRGKTTLAKILAGNLTPLKGGIKINPQVKMGFYEQGNTAKLDNKSTVEEEVASAHPGKYKTEVTNMCGAMMFSGGNMQKKISVLSGGERSRVLLAKTILEPSNLLILDEPTHHLDMESCAALFEAVQEYDGAVIVVTHDEYFLHQVATKLIVFMADRVMIFPGNYSEFLEQIGWDENEPTRKNALAAEAEKEYVKRSAADRKQERKARADERSARRQKLGSFESEIARIEGEIVVLDKEHAAQTELLIRSSEKKDYQTVAEASKQLKDLNRRIDILYGKLDTLLRDHEHAKKEFEDTGE